VIAAEPKLRGGDGLPDRGAQGGSRGAAGAAGAARGAIDRGDREARDAAGSPPPLIERGKSENEKTGVIERIKRIKDMVGLWIGIAMWLAIPVAVAVAVFVSGLF
jgi:hypothetical protein